MQLVGTKAPHLRYLSTALVKHGSHTSPDHKIVLNPIRAAELLEHMAGIGLISQIFSGVSLSGFCELEYDG